MTPREMADRQFDELLGSRNLPPLPADRLKQIEAAVMADLKPVRPLASDGAYIAVLVGIFIGVCAIGCYVAGQHGWRALSGLQRLAVFVPLALTTGSLAFSVVRQMRPAAKYARSSAVATTALFVLLLGIMTLVFRAAQESSLLSLGWVCFRTGMAFAIPAALIFAFVLSRGAALSPVLTGATAGGLAGLVGLAVLEIHCPNLNLYHILVGHVSVTLVCVAAGVIFSSVTFRRRTSNH
jgi:hypothetical protein